MKRKIRLCMKTLPLHEEEDLSVYGEPPSYKEVIAICSRCMYKNEPGSRKCEMCDALLRYRERNPERFASNEKEEEEKERRES